MMQNIVASGHCPFCMENLRLYHKRPILKETEHWILTENQWPYEGAKVHLLAITKAHVEKLNELPKNAGEELLELMKFAESEYKLAGGSFFMRFGNMEHTGSTVKHLHAQLISGEPRLKPDGTENEKLKVKLAYKSLPTI